MRCLSNKMHAPAAEADSRSSLSLVPTERGTGWWNRAMNLALNSARLIGDCSVSSECTWVKKEDVMCVVDCSAQ